MICRALNGTDKFLLLPALVFLSQLLSKTNDAIERRSYFVTHAGQKFLFHFRQLFSTRMFFFELCAEAIVPCDVTKNEIDKDERTQNAEECNGYHDVAR